MDHDVGSGVQHSVVALADRAAAVVVVLVPVRLEDDFGDAPVLAVPDPGGGDVVGARSSAMRQHHVGEAFEILVELAVDGVVVVPVLAAGDGDERAVRDIAGVERGFPGAGEFLAVDPGGDFAGLADMGAAARRPDLARLAEIDVAGEVPDQLEGIPFRAQ